MMANICKFRKIILAFMTLLACSVIFSCSSDNSKVDSKSLNYNDDFLEFVKKKGENLNDVTDAYEDIEYVKYNDIEKYYSNSELNDKVILYEGDIEYYDRNDNLIKKDEKVTKLISTSDGKIDSEGINKYGYLINCFGMFELDPGFHKYGDNYYYVSNITHYVAKCSNATMSNAIRENNRKIITKDDKEYIVYTDDERNGEVVKNSISNIEGEVYLTDENGKIVTEEGIHHVSNIYDNTFHLVYEGLDGRYRKVNDRYFDCYVNKDGKVVVANKIDINGKTYCADFDGVLVKNTYLITGLGFDENMVYTGNEELDNLNLRLIYSMINSKRVDYSNNKDYELYKSNIATKSEAINYFFSTMFHKDVYAFKNGEMVVNDKVKYHNSEYFAGKDGRFLSGTVVDDYKYKLLIDNDGLVVRDKWIFDKQYFDDERLNGIKEPYIKGYGVDRAIVKPYLGYYILATGEIMTDDVFIESAVFDKEKNVVTKFRVKNGEFDGTYDEYLYFINTYKEEMPEYNYEEYDEGDLAYVHRYTDASRTKKIDKDDVDAQLKYNKLLFEIKRRGQDYYYKDAVYFGKYYNHDKNGEILEPIEWDILERKDGMALLITSNVIDYREFDVNGNNDWEESSIRKWLNDDFLNLAFSEEEQERILSNSQDEGRSGTNDKVFLLSMDEYVKYNEENKEDSIYNWYFNVTNFSMGDMSITESIASVRNMRFRSVYSDLKDEYKKDYTDIWMMGTKYLLKASSKTGIRPAIWVKYNDK